MNNADLFPTTHWTLVFKASHLDETIRLTALNQLLTSYRKPLLHYVLTRCQDKASAEDILQDYLKRLANTDFFTGLHPNKGKLRAYLSITLSNFIRNHERHTETQRRGGKTVIISMAELPEINLCSTNATPDQIFDQAWAKHIATQALELLKIDSEQSGESQEFNLMQETLNFHPIPQSLISSWCNELHISIPALKTRIHRFRKRYAQRIRDLIKPTIGRDDDIKEEIQYLAECLAAQPPDSSPLVRHEKVDNPPKDDGNTTR